MTKNVCGNCKYWERNLPTFPPHEHLYGSCNNPKVTGTFMDVQDADTISHYGEFSTYLSFGENFGCIHFDNIDSSEPDIPNSQSDKALNVQERNVYWRVRWLA